MSRNPHEPTDKTRAEVSALASFGVRREDIASYIGIDAKTLRKHYPEELDNSTTKANAAVGKFLYQAASGQAIKDGASYSDCVRAAMFWAKTRMQWRETSHHDVTSNGETISQPTTVQIVGPDDDSESTAPS